MDGMMSGFTARLIMTPAAELTCADAPEEAEAAMASGGFEVVPVRHGEGLGAYWRRGADGRPGRHEIELRDVVSDGCAITRLVELLATRTYVFVLGSDRTVGYIHFSDLNRSAAKVPFFILFEALERGVVGAIGPRLNSETLRAALGGRASDIEKKHLKQQRKGSDHSLVNAMYFPEMLEVARHFGVASMEPAGASVLAHFRNRVAHADRELVGSHADVSRLAGCAQLLRSAIAQVRTLNLTASQ
jgi:hypothetical protein